MDLALFDFDGTITDRETMPDFMHMAVRPGRLLLGKVLLLPLILGYKAKLVSGVAARAAICLIGFLLRVLLGNMASGTPFSGRQALGGLT